MVTSGGQTVGYNGSGTADCPFLEPLLNYVGFNGNGVRRGQGYRLRTWMTKAGYGADELLRFLDDLTFLCNALGLIVAAIGKGHNNWCTRSHVSSLVRSDTVGQRELDRLHIRVYTKADCVERWNRIFQWDATPGTALQEEEGVMALDVVERLREYLCSSGLQQRQVASRLKVSKQYLSAVLGGKKRCSDKLKQQIEKYLDRHTNAAQKNATQPGEEPPFKFVNTQVKKGSTTLRKAALNYYDRGLCVIPIRSWEVSRRPFVRWTAFQKQRPTRQQVIDWWTKWPDAGIAVILGPVCNLFCVDVDGENAHRILIDLLGRIPLAPTVKSGSEDPFRFHLYFRHPEQLATAASKTPFNHADDKGKLELRGEKGLLVLPPSLHKSGRRYAFVQGRSLDDVELSNLPDVLLEALEAESASPPATTESDVLPTVLANRANGHAVDFSGYYVAPSTVRFLSGQHAQSANWNQRLFRAGCDLNARGVPRGKAEDLLLRGAKPRTSADKQVACLTISSAYSQPRKPSQY